MTMKETDLSIQELIMEWIFTAGQTLISGLRCDNRNMFIEMGGKGMPLIWGLRLIIFIIREKYQCFVKYE